MGDLLNTLSNVGSAVSGFSPVASIATGVLGAITGNNQAKQNLEAQREANATNLRIAQENNWNNYNMFKEGNAFSEYMWNKQNEYNDPAAQVARLKAAGINPSSVFGNGSVSEAGSISSGSPVPGSAPTVHPEVMDRSQMYNNMFTAINAFNQSMMTGAQVDKYGADTQLALGSNRRENDLFNTRLEWLQKQASKEGWLGEQAREELSFMQASRDFRLGALTANNQLMEQQAAYIKEQVFGQQLANKIAEVQAAYAEQMSRSQYQQLLQNIAKTKVEVKNIMANTALTDEARLKVIEEKTGVILENGLKSENYEVARKLQQTIINTAQEDLWAKEDERFMRPIILDRDGSSWLHRYGYHTGSIRGAQYMLDNNQYRYYLK